MTLKQLRDALAEMPAEWNDFDVRLLLDEGAGTLVTAFAVAGDSDGAVILDGRVAADAFSVLRRLVKAK